MTIPLAPWVRPYYSLFIGQLTSPVPRDPMTITAKYAATCPTCNAAITPGSKIEWSKGTKARHAACTGSAPATARKAPTSRNWDPNAFAGYGAPRGAFRKACVSDGNCSSHGSGRSCGGHDCDGF